MSDKPKYPDIKVKLVGEDGNAFSIMSRCARAMRLAGKTKRQVGDFMEEATSGDYDHLLRTCMSHFNCK